MDCRKLALGIAAAALAMYGCGPGAPQGTVFEERDFVCASGAAQPCDTTEPAHTDAERTAPEPEDTEDTTYTFVVNLLSLPSAEAGGPAAGFNLDEIDSGGLGTTDPEADCEHAMPDFTSLTDPDHVGVDNALAGGLADTIATFLECPAGVDNCLDHNLLQQINEGSVLLIVQVSGVNSLDYDSEIQLQLFRGQVPGGAAPMLVDGALAPDQTFDIVEALGDPVSGDIFDGRVRAATPSLTLSITTSDFTIPLVISEPEIRFDLTSDGLVNGNIGGYLTIDDLVEVGEMIMPGVGGTVRSIGESSADIEPTSDNPLVCSALSLGITFAATTATANGG